MVFTVQFSFPSAKANDERSQIREAQEHGLFLHGITGASFVHVLLRNALERLCAPAQSESFKRRRVEPSDCKEKRAVRATDVSVLRALGLPEDDKTSDNLLLRIYERRLRNESTPKYLDWWSRKGSSMEQSVSNVPEAPAPIVPQHVLDVVSTLRPSSSQAVDSPLTNDALRVYVKVPVHATLEALLRALPETFGVVEYPEMELWHPEALAAAERRNQVRLVPINVPGDATSEPSGQDNALRASASPADAAPTAAAAEPRVATLSTLVDYASSDEE